MILFRPFVWLYRKLFGKPTPPPCPNLGEFVTEFMAHLRETSPPPRRPRTRGPSGVTPTDLGVPERELAACDTSAFGKEPTYPPAPPTPRGRHDQAKTLGEWFDELLDDKDPMTSVGAK